MQGRSGKQCRERWHNQLDPSIKKEQWTEEEDRILLQALWPSLATSVPACRSSFWLHRLTTPSATNGSRSQSCYMAERTTPSRTGGTRQCGGRCSRTVVGSMVRPAGAPLWLSQWPNLAQRHRAFAGDDYEMDEKENEPLDCSSNSESPARKRPCRSQPSASIGSTTLVNKQTVDRTLCGTGAAAVRLMPIFASAFRGRTASECSLIAETKSPVQIRPFGGGGGLSDMQVWPSAASSAPIERPTRHGEPLGHRAPRATALRCAGRMPDIGRGNACRLPPPLCEFRVCPLALPVPCQRSFS